MLVISNVPALAVMVEPLEIAPEISVSPDVVTVEALTAPLIVADASAATLISDFSLTSLSNVAVPP